MMKPLARADLWSLEEYAEQRPAFRSRVLAHKKNRQVALGANARLYFEDRLTIHYQIQEMLRIEKVFEADGIVEELELLWRRKSEIFSKSFRNFCRSPKSSPRRVSLNYMNVLPRQQRHLDHTIYNKS